MLDNKRPRYDFVDSLRGVAILLVIAVHSVGVSFGFDQLKWTTGFGRDFDVGKQFLIVLPATFGWAGVAVFFAISGFCIHNSFSKESRLGFFRYIVKRFYRIYPPYFLPMLVFYILGAERGGDYGNFITHALLIHNYFPAYFLGINGAFWSIAIEFQLYIIYIFLFVLIERFGWRVVLAGCLCVELCVRIAMGHFLMTYGTVPKFISGLPLAYLFSWTIGAAAAELCNRNAPTVFQVKRLHIVALIVTGVGCCFVKPLAAFSFLLFATATALCMVYMHEQNVPFRVPALAKIGLISYSIYLIHLPILYSISSLFGRDIPLLTFVVSLFGTVPVYMVSKIMWKHVEIPSINAGAAMLRKLELRAALSTLQR
jgi:peptidoglycan/LPS O-acetylase OafA/YrhL